MMMTTLIDATTPASQPDPIELWEQDETDLQSLLRLALAAALSIAILALVTQLLA